MRSGNSRVVPLTQASIGRVPGPSTKEVNANIALVG